MLTEKKGYSALRLCSNSIDFPSIRTLVGNGVGETVGELTLVLSSSSISFALPFRFSLAKLICCLNAGNSACFV